MTQRQKRIAILGLGAVGSRVLASLQNKLAPDAIYAVFDRNTPADSPLELSYFDNVDALLRWKPDLAVECAGHSVVFTVVPQLLRSGIDVLVVSIGALADADLRSHIVLAAQAGQCSLLTVPGAIGGLDALEAARSAGLSSVVYSGRKPPMAWKDTLAEDRFNLNDLREPTVIFEGSAGESASLYPKNANVTAAVALAGVGFENTRVRLIADPHSSLNVHELEANGAFGRFNIRLENKPLPDNVKTSWLAALSIEAALRKYLFPSIL
ncbi:MAG: aspartate dehydrogenase [Alcaligenaceae bacterium]|nr:MAG: aspartate dehydrogenase [Alcaligenaceae bacterium]